MILTVGWESDVVQGEVRNLNERSSAHLNDCDKNDINNQIKSCDNFF